MTDTTNLEGRVEENGKDYRKLARIGIGLVGLAGLGTYFAVNAYSGNTPTGEIGPGIWDGTVGFVFKNAPLPLIGVSATIPFSVASRDEETRQEEPYWGPIKGVLGGMAVNAVTSGFKLWQGLGQYAPGAWGDKDLGNPGMQYLQDMLAACTILAVVYAATAGVMNLCEGIYRNRANAKVKREARRAQRNAPVQAQRVQ